MVNGIPDSGQELGNDKVVLETGGGKMEAIPTDNLSPQERQENSPRPPENALMMAAGASEGSTGTITRESLQRQNEVQEFRNKTGAILEGDYTNPEDLVEHRWEINWRTSIPEIIKQIDDKFRDNSKRSVDYLQEHSRQIAEGLLTGAQRVGTAATIAGAAKLAYEGGKAIYQVGKAAAGAMGQAIETTAPAVEQTVQKAAETAAPIVESGKIAAEQGLERTGQAIGESLAVAGKAIGEGLTEASPYIKEGGKALLIGVAATETVLLLKETTEGAWDLTKRGVKRASSEAARTVDNVVGRGVPTLFNKLTGEVLANDNTKKFIEQAGRVAGGFANRMYNLAGLTNEAIEKIVNPLAKRTTSDTESLQPLLKEQRGKRPLRKVANNFEKQGHKGLARIFGTADSLVTFCSKVHEMSSSIVEQSSIRASEAREMANTIDANIQAITEEASDIVKAHGIELLKVSEQNRAKIMNDLQAQFNMERAKRGITLAGDTIKERMMQALQQYSAQSPVYKLGSKVVRGIGRFAKVMSVQTSNIAGKVGNTIQEVQDRLNDNNDNDNDNNKPNLNL